MVRADPQRIAMRVNQGGGCLQTPGHEVGGSVVWWYQTRWSIATDDGSDVEGRRRRCENRQGTESPGAVGFSCFLPCATGVTMESRKGEARAPVLGNVDGRGEEKHSDGWTDLGPLMLEVSDHYRGPPSSLCFPLHVEQTPLRYFVIDRSSWLLVVCACDKVGAQWAFSASGGMFNLSSSPFRTSCLCQQHSSPYEWCQF